MPTRFKNQRAEVEFNVLKALIDNPFTSTRQVAKKVSISTGAAFYCINALAEKGLVKIKNFAGSQNKKQYIYIVTPKGIKEKTALTSKFLKRKLEEFEELKKEIDYLKKNLE